MKTKGTDVYTVLTSAFDPVADTLGIIVDERVGDPVFMNGTDMDGNTDATLGYGKQDNMDWGTDSLAIPTLALLVSGDSMVRYDGLILESTAVEADVKSALESQGIKVITSLEGLYSTDRKRAFRTL